MGDHDRAPVPQVSDGREQRGTDRRARGPDGAHESGPRRAAWERRGAIAAVGALAGAGDAVIVRQSGREWGTALVAGTVMAVFVAVSILWIGRVWTANRRARSAREAASDGAPAGGWANPRSGQRALTRWRRILDPRGDRQHHPLGGSRRPGNRRRR